MLNDFVIFFSFWISTLTDYIKDLFSCGPLMPSNPLEELVGSGNKTGDSLRGRHYYILDNSKVSSDFQLMTPFTVNRGFKRTRF